MKQEARLTKRRPTFREPRSAAMSLMPETVAAASLTVTGAPLTVAGVPLTVAGATLCAGYRSQGALPWA